MKSVSGKPVEQGIEQNPGILAIDKCILLQSLMVHNRWDRAYDEANKLVTLLQSIQDLTHEGE